MTHTPRAIVIGGGIAGPALSLLLKRAGIEPHTFEAYPQPATIGGGFQIAPNGMRALAVLGIAERIAASGAVTSEFCFRNHHGKVIGRIPPSRSGIAVTTTRAAFQQILLDQAEREGVSIAYGKRLCAIEDTGAEVVAHFEDGSAVRGDLLLGADGVGSRVRALILPEHAQAHYTGFWGVGGLAGPEAPPPPDPHDAHQLSFVLGPSLRFGYSNFSAGEPMWGWWCHLPHDAELPRREIQAISDDELRGRVLQAFRGWHPPVEAFVSTTEHIMRTAIYDVPTLPTWHVGRVMLIGDAAHAMSPAGGQGASLALEDATLLGQRLAAAHAPFDRVFAAVERVRRPLAERVVAQARQNDAQQLKELGVVGCWIRDRLFPLIVPFVARELERQYVAGADRAAAAPA